VRVVVAMSGGVDSSVAAALLKEDGCQVIGMTMQIWPSDEMAEEAEGLGGCCGAGAVADAKTIAHKLGIPHYVVNLKDVFDRTVIADFCHEYNLGRTPNPCIRCNRFVKFDALLKKANELDAEFVATGHYARIERRDADGRRLLKKGVDCEKDQSYFLYSLTQGQLENILFPLGELTKERVRQIAGELRLPVANKAESQEICFIPDNDYSRFVREYVADAAEPGPILDRQGNVLGEHRGIISYTIGQRKGLGISTDKPLYVVAIDRERNAVIVGNKEEVYGTELTAADLNWVSVEVPQQPIRVRTRIRYLHQEADSVVVPLEEHRVQVQFEEPQMAITPGQAAVFYGEDDVLGGGVIQ